MADKKKEETPAPEPEVKPPAPPPAEPPVAPIKEEIQPHPALTEFETMVRKIIGEQNAHNDERFTALEARLPAAEKKETPNNGVQKEEQKPVAPAPAPEPKPAARKRWKLWRSL